MDAGCSKHGCWYRTEGFRGCFDDPNGDGRCILGFAVSSKVDAGNPYGIDLSHCATLPGSSISVNEIADGPIHRAEWHLGQPVTADVPWRPWEREDLPRGVYTLHPASVVSGRAFDITWQPGEGQRGIVYRQETAAPHTAGEHQDFDIWLNPGVCTWLFYQGAWREVDDLDVSISYPPPRPLEITEPQPRADMGTIRLRGTWH